MARARVTGVPGTRAAPWGRVVLLLLALAARRCSAYPEYWVDNGLANSCTAQPEKRYGGHGAPAPDRATTFTLTPAAGGAAVVALCPGAGYAVRVAYAEERRTLLTASAGVFASAAAGSECPNRATSVDGPGVSFSDTLTLPCSVPGGTVQLKATSAAGSRDSFHSAATSLPVKPLAQCPGSPCPGAPAAAAAAAAPAAKPAAAATPAPKPAAAAAAPAPKPAAAAATPVTKAAAAGTPAAAAHAPTPGCDPSAYGYACAVAVRGGATLHFTRGGAAPPANPCTASAPAASAAGAAPGELLHLLLESPSSGYAGLSFPATPGRMVPADAVIGWLDPASGAPKVSAYALENYSPRPSATNFAGNGWASNLGAAHSADGHTLVCFSRATGGAADGSATGRRLLQSAQPLDLSALHLNWASDQSTTFVVHSGTGSVTLDASGGAAGVTVSGDDASGVDPGVVAHGALMLATFALMLPAGALAARHKWLAGDRAAGGLRGHWFSAHRALQSLSLVASLAGFMLILVVCDVPWAPGAPLPNPCFNAHRGIGIAVMWLMLAQVAAGFLRPALCAPRRAWWRRGHLTAGWLTIVLGLVAVALGIVLVPGGANTPLLPWVVAAVVPVGLLLLVGLGLEFRKTQLERGGRYAPARHEYACVGSRVDSAAKPIHA
ncbi:cytochrome b561 and DOMON domain-containing protein [Scenedesmus sp. PABB004]|nr:cytochrome b561 and DOMON domain-containing protein [Scenedesmus sp. PABB004]